MNARILRQTRAGFPIGAGGVGSGSRRWTALAMACLLAGGTAAAARAQGPRVSFSRQVAPLLVAKCGGCHVAGRKGNFQMASYNALMSSGKVQPGAANGSRLVEVILSGDMPRGGGKVSPAELGLLQAWINSGAACDAPDPTIGLDQLARGAMAPQPASPSAPRPALKPGEISFASDVAPVLVEHCGNCHGEADPEGGLRMSSFARLMRGGRTGPAIMASKGKASLLIEKLRGTAAEGQRMPLGREPLPGEVIATIEKWIDQGASLDLLGPDDELDAVAAAGRSRSLGDADLLKARATAAAPVWRQAIPDEKPVIAARRRITTLGNLPAERLADVADQAEELEGEIRELLIAGDGPLLKGGIVLYLFGRAFDYSAFWQEVVGRERPRGISGHAGMTGDVVYAAVLVPSSGGDDLRLMIAEQIAAAALAGRAAPEWFSQGVGRTVGGKLVPKAPLAKDWKRDAGAAVSEIGSPADFVGGLAERASVAVAAGNFLTAVAPPAKLARLVTLLDEGRSFPEAFATVFKGTPEQNYAAWAAKQKPGRR